MKNYRHWIDGIEQAATTQQWIESVDPYRGTAWARISRGSNADAERAIAAAKRAMTLGPWSTMAATQRGKILRCIADQVLDNIDRLAEIEVRDNGKLLAEMKGQLQFTADVWTYYAGLADKIEGAVMPIEKADTLALTFREPVGVVTAITAWNSPLSFLATKCAPALAAGCSVVIKPSEFSSASSLEFAALTREAGLPNGVLNVVTGYGHEIGPTLVEHPDVALITFTGSDRTGARINETAARHLKKTAMELGGKSPNIIFDDADLEAAVGGAVAGIFGAAGQMCTAGSRLLVQNSIKNAVTEKLLDLTRAIRVGNPMDPNTEMGPISTRPQFEKVLQYIDIAHADGARCITGGRIAEGPGIQGGQFIEPTIFTDVTNQMRIAQEEVFGPILSIIGFDDEAEAIDIANDIAFGLAAGVWTQDLGRLMRMSRALDVGTVWGNTYRTYSYTMPFGGRKRSGLGKEWGVEGIHDYLETKSVMISTAKLAASFVPR